MRDSLYEFLILNKKLSLPGIGTISMLRNAAQHDYADRLFTSPYYSFKIESKNDKPSKKLFDWLCSATGIAEWDAMKAVNDFSFELKRKLSDEGEVNWEKIGIFRRDNNGDITLDPHTISLTSEETVTADKVIRVKAEHTVLVGEKERTSVEMEEYLSHSSPQRNYLWIIAIILIVLATMFIGWYFSENGFSPSSAGNQSVIKTN
jgi:transcriptional regulator with XRE-family HTH domain